MIRKCGISALLLAITLPLGAAAQDAVTPVETLIRCQIAGGIVMMTIAGYVAEGDTSHMAESNAAFDKGLECLDANIKQAVASVGANLDARNAIKDFYAKASAYLTAAKPIPSEGRRVYDARRDSARGELDAASAKLRLEMKLASAP
jgi:hypothetical protein